MPTDETTAQAGTGTEAPTTTSGTDDANSDTSTITIETTDNQEADRRFTQAELNAILKRETKKATDAVKAQVQQERDDAEKSEAQKATDRAEEAERKATDAESRIADMAKRSAISIAVSDSKLNVRDRKAVADLIKRDALEVEGETVNGIDAELKRIKAEYPGLFYNSTADGGAQSSTNSEVSAGLGRLQNAYANSSSKGK